MTWLPFQCRHHRPQLSFYDYLSSRLLRPDVDEDGNVVHLPSILNEELLPVNRFQAMARLGSVYLVDQVSRALDSALEWQKNNQQTIFGGTTNLNNFMAQGEDNNDSYDYNSSDDDGDNDRQFHIDIQIY